MQFTTLVLCVSYVIFFAVVTSSVGLLSSSTGTPDFGKKKRRQDMSNWNLISKRDKKEKGLMSVQDIKKTNRSAMGLLCI